MKNIIASLSCRGAQMHPHVCALTHTGALIVKEQKQELGAELLLGRAHLCPPYSYQNSRFYSQPDSLTHPSNPTIEITSLKIHPKK